MEQVICPFWRRRSVRTALCLLALTCGTFRLFAQNPSTLELPERIDLAPAEPDLRPTPPRRSRRPTPGATVTIDPDFPPLATPTTRNPTEPTIDDLPDFAPAPPKRLWLVDDPETPAKAPFETWGIEPPHEGHIVRQALYRKSVLIPHTNWLGLVEIQLEATLAARRPLLETGTLVTPFFRFNWFDNSPVPGTPDTVYNAGVELRRVHQWTQRFTTDLAVAPALFTDFNNSRPDAFRVIGRGVALYDFTPQWQLVLGAMYLGRDDVKILPIAGVTWRPNQATEIEAVFPRPRFSRRFTPPEIVQNFSRRPIAPLFGFSPYQQYWLYVAGELGGNTWAVRQPDGGNTRFTNSDIRLLLGIEQRATEGPRGRVEIGYVFDRYEQLLGQPQTPLHDTLLLRGELAH